MSGNTKIVKKFFLTLVIVFITCYIPLFAQEKHNVESKDTRKDKAIVDMKIVDMKIVESKGMSIEDCISYALQNNMNVKDKLINQKIFNSRLKEFLADAFPDIKLKSSITDNLSLRKSIIDTSTFGPPGTPKNEVPVAFGLQYTGEANVSLRQMVANGSFFVGLEASRTYKKLAKVDIDRTSVDIKELIIKAYLGVQVTKERIAFLQANEKRLIQLIAETEVLHQQGFANLTDLNRIKISKTNISASLRKSIVGLQVAIDMLKLQMGLPYDEHISLSSTLEYVSNKLELPNFDDYTHDKNMDYNYLKVQRTLAKLNYKEKQVSRAPSLYFNGNYGYNTGTNDFSSFFDGNRWFDFVNISLNVTVPIFMGFKKTYSAQISRLQIYQLDNQIDNFERKTNTDIKNKLDEYHLLEKNLEEYKNNQEMAKEIFETSNLKFKEGMASNLEIIEAQTAFREAQTNYFSALYDVLVTKVTLNKLYGNLNEDF